jgi:hypothetical protein
MKLLVSTFVGSWVAIQQPIYEFLTKIIRISCELLVTVLQTFNKLLMNFVRTYYKYLKNLL